MAADLPPDDADAHVVGGDSFVLVPGGVQLTLALGGFVNDPYAIRD